MALGRPTCIAIAACLVAGAAPAAAHDMPRRSVLNAFVRVEGRELHLVVRVPLDVLAPVHFPAVGREIDVAAAGPASARALAALAHDLVLREGDAQLVPSAPRGRLSLPSDRSFERYESALAHVREPLAPGTVVYFDQGFFDAELTYPVASPASRFRIQTILAAELRDHVKLAIRYEAPGATPRAMVISSLSGVVALDPTWHEAARGFAVLGIGHILTGVDHLLFLLCLVIPFAAVRKVVPIVTAFTVAHSFTLIGAAYDLAPTGPWFPPFVETAIAASIVYMALENIVGADLRRRWLVTALFGLVHGFGFSYGLRENLQFAGRHLTVSLLAFNVGIEIGQLLVLAAALPALALLRRHALHGRVGTVLLSAIVAHTGWHWMIERGETLWRVEWPRLDAAALATLARWVTGILLAGGAVWLAARRASALLRRPERERASTP